MSDKRGQNFLHGAAIYAAGIVVVKILGFIYKFILMHVMTTAGYGYFKVAYNVFNVFLTISTAGIPVALSRMISEADALGKAQQKRRIFSVAYLTLIALGGIGTVAMLLFPQQLAVFMGSVRATQGIFVMAPSVVLVCMIAAYRGYAQGHSDMIPSTLSQVIETAVKVAVGLAFALLFIHLGKSESITAAGAIAGTTVSSLVTLVYLVVSVRKKYEMKPAVTADSDVPDKHSKVFWDFLKIAVPITISGTVLSLVNLLDTKLVLNQLQTAGYTELAADTLYGVYSKTMDLYNLPYYFVVPLGASIMPAIAAARMKGEGGAGDLAENVLRIMTLLCLPMAVGMGVLAEPCMQIISNCYEPQGAPLMTMMAVASYLMCFAVMTNSILPANGNERLPIYSILVGGLVKIGVNYVLVGNPEINVYGAPVGTICCYLVIAVMNLVFMARHMDRPMNLGRILLRPALSSAAMGVAAWAVWSLAGRFIGSTLVCFALGVAAGVAVYAVLIIALRAITLEDMKLIPKGEKIAKLLRIR